MERTDSGIDGVESRALLLEQLKVLKEEVKYNRSKINEMERKWTSDVFDHSLPMHPLPAEPAHTEVTEDTDMTTRDYMYLTAKKTIPVVRECDFSRFKNRFEPDGSDGHCAVDALVSGPLLHQEIQEEQGLRKKLFEQRRILPSTRIVKDKGLAKVVKMANAQSSLISQAQSEEKWPRRLRIQSPALLRILAKVNKEKWSDRPRTYYRPFNSLIYQHPQMKQALEELEKNWGSQLDAETISNAETTDTNDEGADGEAEDDDSVANSPQALLCLRAYVKYMDEKIMPAYRQFEEKDVTSNARVRFSDLWYLFRTGELVYRQLDGELPDRRDFRTGKRIWKTYYVDSVPERLVGGAADDVDIKDTAVINDETAFTLGCYHIDHTGEGFCVVEKEVKIEHFTGEMPVVGLPVYPMRFCQDHETRLQHAKNTGESLLRFMEAKHCSYSGWTLTRDPSGDAITDANGVQLQQPEHINSEVMVDFGEAFQYCPDWRPQQANLRKVIPEGLTVQDDFRIRWWSGPDRTALLGETAELIPVKSGVVAKQRNKHVTEDPLLNAVWKNNKNAQPTTEKDLTEEAKALLTGRVFAYVFQERKFAQLGVAKLLPSPKTGLALDSLKIPQAIKDSIQGSIQGHFLQKNAERKIEHDWVSLDLIEGKGRGLFILLHGVPGVGKTATAEAIAKANGKPLFKITVGDLGMTPEKLEASLREIFRLASIWDCILLLDEVDTFFSARGRSDATGNKNAMVSVFLRVLDYYDGILFLTTNRGGVLDEAFKSRIHYKILYQELSLEQTLDIWKLNIQRTREIEKKLADVEHRPELEINDAALLYFARQQFHSQSRGIGRWNGRQIRNAFQVARSLAYYEHNQREEELARRRQSAGFLSPDSGNAGDTQLASLNAPVLHVHHFETMHAITTSFENYLVSLRDGATDAQLAFETEQRHDSYHDELTDILHAQYREEHERAAAAAGGSVGATVDPNTGGVTITANIAVPGQMQSHQPRSHPHHQQQQYDPGDGDAGEGLSPADTLPFERQQPQQQQHPHRGSLGSTRNRSGSYLSGVGQPVATPSPPNVVSGFDLTRLQQQQQQQQQQQARFSASPQPRQGGISAMRDNAGFPGGNNLDNGANYLATGGGSGGGGGFAGQNAFNSVPRNIGGLSAGNFTTASISPGIRPQQYVNDAPGGGASLMGMGTTNRAPPSPSPAMGEGGGVVPFPAMGAFGGGMGGGAGRDYQAHQQQLQDVFYSGPGAGGGLASGGIPPLSLGGGAGAREGGGGLGMGIGMGMFGTSPGAAAGGQVGARGGGGGGGVRNMNANQQQWAAHGGRSSIPTQSGGRA